MPGSYYECWLGLILGLSSLVRCRFGAGPRFRGNFDTSTPHIGSVAPNGVMIHSSGKFLQGISIKGNSDKDRKDISLIVTSHNQQKMSRHIEEFSIFDSLSCNLIHLCGTYAINYPRNNISLHFTSSLCPNDSLNKRPSPEHLNDRLYYIEM